MKLSIIVPAYNEEKRIKQTLRDYYLFFNKKFKKNFEMIIIPNNCRDRTIEVVKKFSNKKSQIKIFNIPEYSGKGGAVMYGFKFAKGDCVGFTDADNSTSPQNFFKLYQNIDKFDGIIGSRKINGARINPKRRFIQNASSFLFNLVATLLFNFKYKDTQCGAKLFTKNTTSLLIKKSQEKGWIFDVELLYICKKNKLKILESPIV